MARSELDVGPEVSLDATWHNYHQIDMYIPNQTALQSGISEYLMSSPVHCYMRNWDILTQERKIYYVIT